MSKKEAELLQREIAVEKREKALEAKLASSPDPLGLNIPDEEKTMDQLVMSEKLAITSKLDKKHPRPPQIFY